jgi:large subunit ribosomal protein L9
MSTIKVILAKDLSSLGEEGDIKNVKRGYARNFLFPRGIAIECSKYNLLEIEQKKDYYEKRKLEKKEYAAKLKELLESKKVTISISAGDKGRLFGTVTAVNIADELNKVEELKTFGYTVEKKNIELNDHIKFQGNYKYRIHLYQEVYANMELHVEAKVEKQKEEKGKRRKFDRSRKENTETVPEVDVEVENSEKTENNETQENS